MSLFDMSGTDVIVHVDMLAIPQFNRILKAYPDNDEWNRILKYVILNNYPLSRYVASYISTDRKAILRKEFLEGIDISDELLHTTEVEFIDLHDSLKAKLLRRLRATMEEFMSDLDAGKIGLEKVLDYGPKAEKLIASITKLEEDVKMELAGKSKIKGGYKLGILEQRGSYR